MAVKMQEIAEALGTSPGELAFLEVLDDAARQRLLADLEDARAAHAAHIESSMRKAFNHVPRILRRPLRKLFGV